MYYNNKLYNFWIEYIFVVNKKVLLLIVLK